MHTLESSDSKLGVPAPCTASMADCCPLELLELQVAVGFQGRLTCL